MLINFDDILKKITSIIQHPTSSLLIGIHCYSKHNRIKDYLNFNRL